MLQRDFIMRTIEEMAKVISMALKLKNEGKILDSIMVIKDIYNQLPDIDQERINSMTPKELEHFCIEENNYDLGYIEALANLLYHEGEFQALDNQQEKTIICFEKSILLFDFVQKNSNVFSFERVNTILRIKGFLKAI